MRAGHSPLTGSDVDAPPSHLSVVPDPAPRPHHYPELDGLRGTAIALVLVGHVFQFALPQGPWAAQLASLGVMVFFALSGFLITDLLCREHARTGRVRLGTFFLRRALRLLPAFVVFIAFVAVGRLAGWVTDASWKGIAAALFYVRNIFGQGETTTHLWSLSMEEQFYAVWPLAFVLLTPRRALGWAVGASVAVGVVRAGLIHFHVLDYNTGVFYLRPWFRFDSLLWGCIVALARNGGPRPRALLERVTAVVPPLLWPVGLVCWSLFAEAGVLRPVFSTVQGVLAAGLVAMALGRREAWGVGLLRARWLGVLGLFSYSLYLWQQPFLVTRVPDWGVLRQFPMSLVLTAAAAAASYFLVERPFLRLKDRLSASGARAPSA